MNNVIVAYFWNIMLWEIGETKVEFNSWQRLSNLITLNLNHESKLNHLFSPLTTLQCSTSFYHPIFALK